MSGRGFVGRLNERVMIERWHSQQDDLACDPGEWVKLKSLWAHVDSKAHVPGVEGATRSVRQRWLVTIRDVEDVDFHCRLIWRGRHLKPLSFSRDLKRQTTILTEEQSS